MISLTNQECERCRTEGVKHKVWGHGVGSAIEHYSCSFGHYWVNLNDIRVEIVNKFPGVVPQTGG